MAKPIYHGFSSNNWLTQSQFGISNIDAVKQDLFNHLMTSKGDRVMMPNFGTRIPLLTFEPNDETTRQIVYDDVKYVIDYDPRVSLISLQTVSLPDNNAIVALADILYIEFNVTDVLRIEVKTGS